MKVQIARVNAHDTLPLPSYETAGASGMDLRAVLGGEVWVPAGDKRTIPTGIRVAVPPGYEIQVRPRSGLAAKHMVTVLNTPGTIDSDYRGEIKVILANLSSAPFKVNHGDRIAQMVLCPVVHMELEMVEDLPETARGAGGFGSTGAQ